jgi:hypothetical protein
MLRVLKTQRARRRAVTMISPFVKRSRAAREIPDSIWFDPYFVGFISMLITLIGSQNGRLSNDDLAAVQSRSWAAITGMRAELIGDEICSLSAAHDERFELGCRNALSFFEALQSGEALADLFRGRPDDPEQLKRTALWAQHFDSYVSEYLSVYMR